MPVKRKTAKTRIAALTDFEWMVLTDQIDPTKAEGIDGYTGTYFQAPGALTVPSLGDQWITHGQDITGAWIEEHPGTRPAFWWKFTSPRWVDFDPIQGEPRRRLGGGGEAEQTRRADSLRHDLLAWDRGVPIRWTDIDPTDPPTFESQATYLQRHWLLTPDEAERLTPADFEPEAVTG